MSPPIPAGVEEAAALTAHLDRVLGEGFARLAPAQVASLRELADAFVGTPLGPRVHEAVTALGDGELLAHHLAALAAARESLEGARHDALLAAAAAERGLVVGTVDVQPGPMPGAEATVRMESARQWLVEVALAGLANLDNSILVPIVATLEGLQTTAELGGLATLLTGFADELLDHAPTSAVDSPPLRRWADLWSRCILATYSLPEVCPTETVDGRLFPLGADVRHHDHVLSIVVHGLLETPDGQRHLVRTPLTAWKVDAVTGAEIWNLVRPLAPALLDALSADCSLSVSKMELSSDGVLRWREGGATPGEAFDPWSVDLSGAVLHPPALRHRHPLQIGLPTLYTGEPPAPVDLARTSPHAGLAAKDLKGASVMGLLRFDGGWTLQPLGARKGSQRSGPAAGIATARSVRAPVLDVLRERASKLLRA
ncbi:MAG: hypothetical protein H6736_22540 [Alphaproteobacteria bacterium]|nr:hypothetical protein [Alphaproteobacteria bacterium]MCB9694598.1 hypothetical protein [Alphaproteobacteria bacterium]